MILDQFLRFSDWLWLQGAVARRQPPVSVRSRGAGRCFPDADGAGEPGAPADRAGGAGRQVAGPADGPRRGRAGGFHRIDAIPALRVWHPVWPQEHLSPAMVTTQAPPTIT